MKQYHKQTDYETVMHLTRGAGKLLMGCLGTANVVLEGKGEKERSGFTTTADVLSLSHIVRGLIDSFPQDGIIAEGLDEEDVVDLLGFEIPIIDKKYPGVSGYFWVIDPLCGTIMHKRGIKDFVVSVALVNDSPDVLFGCVYDPGNDEMFYAMKGEGSYIEAFNRVTPLSVSGVDGNKLREKALVSIEHGLVRRKEEVRELASDIKRQRTAGTCGLELSYVGAGRLDAVLKGKQPLYDFAGGLLIVEEAGGKATDFQGNELTKKLNYEKCTDLLVSNGKVHEALLAYTSTFEKKAA